MELGREQTDALTSVLAWFNEPQDKQHFVLSGYAGTGKTTLMNYLLDELKDVTCATMTGKAMNVLKSKINGKAACRTVHNLLYTPNMGESQKLIDERAALVAQLDEASKSKQEAILRAISKLDEKIDGLSFSAKEVAETEGGLIIVDEASMLSHNVYSDLMQLGRPVLLVGDDMQLPPVQGKSIFAELGVDARLTEVHRQALENPILRLATAIREGDAQTVNMWSTQKFDVTMAARADKVLCYTNKTRHNINRLIRAEIGNEGMNPVAGEKLICTLNVKGYSMINGGEAVATSAFTEEERAGKIIGKGEISYEGKTPATYAFTLENFAGHYMDPKKSAADLASMDMRTVKKFGGEHDDVRHYDFGYAVTVHKAQGSEYDKVFLFDDAQWLGKKPGGMKQRQQWLYTAVTRAKEKLAWVK